MRKNPIVIFRTTNMCNLNCTYCYDKKNRNINEDINKEFETKISDIEKYLDTIYLRKSEICTLIFHGGEPLLLSPNIYEKLLMRITENRKMRLSIQTNGTLINERYIKIFKKYHINIGISIDGCDEEQNYCRIYANGKNSFTKVMQNIELLKQNNVHFGIIMTISKKHIGKEKMLYDFIAKNNINVNLRPAFPTKYADNSYIMTQQEYYEFFKNLFNIWYYDKEETVKLRQIREIYDEFLKVLKDNYCSGSCSEGENCFNKFVSLDIYGNIYSCNRTYNNSNFFLGNLNNQSINEILKKAEKLNMERLNNLKKSKCIDCKIYTYCYGGCPANAYEIHEDYTQAEDYFCEAKKNIFDYIRNKLQETDEIEQYYRAINEKKKELLK